MEESQRGNRRVLKGTVKSNKMDNTVVVNVKRKIRHSMYDKVILRGKNYYAHCEDDSVKEGDQVTIMSTRPISKLKRWRVVPEKAASE